LALQRIRPTGSQVGLSLTQRKQNVQGAFRVAEAARARIAGRAILLVDDVYTSGATVKAATRALLRGGAAAVDVLTFARVVP
jgi:predicted amidophosphoribosyltransferase